MGFRCAHLLRTSRALLPLLLFSVEGRAANPVAEHFRKTIEPLLGDYCGDCHADGERKGNVAFDEFKSDDTLAGSHELWLNVLKNVRAGLMPPKKKPQLAAEERRRLEEWIKYEAFGIDPTQPDPGRVTVRRLNRVEYRNTIRDLMGIDFHSEVEFPPDDTGYGFDTIGDVLTISPILLEKYLTAAKAIVTEAVPTVARVMPETKIAGNAFRKVTAEGAAEERRTNRREGLRSLSYYEPAQIAATFEAGQPGEYRLVLDLAVRGNFDFDPGKCRVVFKVDDRELVQKEFGWHDFKTFQFEFPEALAPGSHRFAIELQPLTPVEKKINSLDLQVLALTVRGPMAPELWTRPPNYERFFSLEAPQTTEERQAAAARGAAEVCHEGLPATRGRTDRRAARIPRREHLHAAGQDLRSWCRARARSGACFAHASFSGWRKARRGFDGKPVAEVDEFSLASRLSYFLWSTMPDDELIGLAARGELRKELAKSSAQADRRPTRGSNGPQFHRAMAAGSRRGRHLDQCPRGLGAGQRRGARCREKARALSGAERHSRGPAHSRGDRGDGGNARAVSQTQPPAARRTRPRFAGGDAARD